MQPREPMLDTYRGLVVQVRATVEAALPKPTTIVEDNRPMPVKQARAIWQPVIAQLDDIDRQLVRLGEGVFRTGVDPDLTSEAKARQISDLADDVSVRVSAARTEVLNRTHLVLDNLRVAAHPARPGTADAAQEAALANTKSDLRMVLDRYEMGAESVHKMTELLGRAVAGGDDLTTWLLASSRWPEDYLTSRSMDDQVAVWSQRVDQALNASSPDNLADVRRAYRQIADPQTGLPVLDPLLNGTVLTLVRVLAEWRPDSRDPQRLAGLEAAQ